MTIGERIKNARKASGLTQAALAEKVRLKRNTIANYETGNIEPSERSVADICAVLGINKQWLLTGEGEMLIQISDDEELDLIFAQIHMSDDPTIRAIIRAYWKLPEAAKESVRQFILEINVLMTTGADTARQTASRPYRCTSCGTRS